MDIESIRGGVETGVLTAESQNYIELDNQDSAAGVPRKIPKSKIYIWPDFHNDIGDRVMFQYA